MYNDKILCAEVAVHYKPAYKDEVLEDLNNLFVGDEDFINNDIVIHEDENFTIFDVAFFGKSAFSKVDRLIDYLKKD